MFNRLFKPQESPVSTATLGLKRPDNFVNTLLSWDPEHNTSLHHAIRHCEKTNNVKLFLEKEGLNSSTEMSRTINDEGYLPIDLVSDTKLEDNAKQELYSMLVPYIITNPLKELSTEIDVKEVLVKYPCSPESEKYKNIQLACFAANEARKALKKSHTHPQINKLIPSERNALMNEVIAMRSESKLNCLKLIVTNPLGLLFDSKNAIYEKLADQALRAGIGNCGEFSYAVLRFIKQLNPNVSVKLCSLDNSDHVFPIIGEGEDAIVCDAWAGEIYPVIEIPKKLKGYKNYPSTDAFFNVITSYNPRFHAVVPHDYSPLSDNMIYLCKFLVSSIGVLGAGLTYMLLNTLLGDNNSSLTPTPSPVA